MLDNRLQLAASLYEPCALGADIGTDHALLPAWLLEQGICQHMLLCDVSPKALAHARDRVNARHLENRTTLCCADGLDAIDAPCGCISITGMGGDTLAGILEKGKDRLQGAVLVLSAHTDQHIVRKTICRLGYHFVREELCLCAGRWYILWRAEPGSADMTEEEIRYGSLLYQSSPDTLREWLQHRMNVLASQLKGLQQAEEPDVEMIDRLSADLTYYRAKWEALA